ncbi:MAG: MATE family efflux transporter [Myxococcota bacterium]|nr:MATE family efflux transporter [Myxococcota bacterium]
MTARTGPHAGRQDEDVRTRRLGQEPIGRLLWSFSLPAIAGMLVGSLYTVIDRAFLGNVVGAEALAGLSVGMPIAFILMAFGMLVGVGSGALISIRLGQGRKDEAERLLGNALALTLVVTVVLTTVLLIFLDPLLVLFGASAQVLPYAREFMQVIVAGSICQHIAFGLNAVIRAEGNPRLAMGTMFINAGLNIVLDVVLILGLGYGVTGAAVATVISQGVSAIWTLAHFRSRRSVIRLRARHLLPSWSLSRPVLAIGLAPFTMHLAASLIALIINQALARHGGDEAIGAYGVINALSMLMLMPIFGIVQGAQPIIGYNFGAGATGRVRQTLKLAAIAATTIMCVGFGFAQAIPELLMQVFTRDPRLLEIGARGLRICLVVAPVVGFQIVGANFFQAIGRARTALVLSLLRQVLILIPLLLILPSVLGLDGVWVAGPIADLLSGVLTGVVLLRTLRRLPYLTPPPGSVRPSPTAAQAATSPP